ncbi:MAG TPA: NADH-quinone oxidoreductase subunit H [Myxococcota bacterium]|nr:NADH-quinone oxidoreductase subunit H [Myxococcota bacterium]HQK50905.1 NADH-quinone oxidoreductase subunit H [Myxococcota bacterium]
MLRLIAQRLQSWLNLPGETGAVLPALAVMLGAALLAFVFIAFFAGPVTWWERRVAGRVMSRIGPNRVGPQGVLQWLADGLKSFLKEDIVPAAADRPLFLFAPYLFFGGYMATFVVLPFGAHLVATDLSVGLLYLIAISGLVVVGILMAGWGSNNKWALFGGIRSAAQLVSYEIPSAFSLLAVVLATGTLSMQGIVRAQGGWPWEWLLFRNPLLFGMFFVSFAASLAENNRTPFDLPEGESELVAGYHVEYSGMRFLWFMFAEWGNLWVIASLATVGFLGGWQIPGVRPEVIDQSTGWAFAGWQALSFLVFAGKASMLVLFAIQIRWTLPRLRVDQMMIVCWKYLVPLALLGSAGVLVLVALVPEGSPVDWFLRAVSLGLGLWLIIAYVRKARAAYLADREPYRRLEGKDPWYPPYRLP